MRLLPLLLLAACGGAIRTVPAERAVPATSPVHVDLDAPGPVRHQVTVSGRGAVALSGLVDLTDPKAAHLEDGDHPIVVPVHVFVHPTAGAFVIDTGMPQGELASRGLVKKRFSQFETEKPLAAILAELDAPLAGVLLTHNHPDHVFGLPDVPMDVPVFVGPGDERPDGFMMKLAWGTMRRGLGDRPLHRWTFEDRAGVGPVPHAVDIVGDGTLWALHVPGHTPGSTAYLARTPDGPVLVTGDCSHTRWGWDHDVPPGSFTMDHGENVESLAWLRALEAAHPGLRVEVGHELGEGTPPASAIDDAAARTSGSAPRDARH